MKFRVSLWVYLSIVSIILAFILYLITKDTTDFLTVTAFLSMIFLALTLIPGNIGKLLPIANEPIKKYIFKLIAKRRDFGIAFGVVILAHAIFAEYKYYNFDILKALTPDIIPGGIALLLIVLMLLTSNFSIQKKLKSWKVIHSIIWFTIPLVLVHGVFSSFSYKGDLGIVNIITTLLLFFAFLKFAVGGINSFKLRDILLIIFGTFVGALFSMINLLQMANTNYLNSYAGQNTLFNIFSSTSSN